MSIINFRDSKGDLSINSQAAVFTVCLFIAILFWILTSMSEEYITTVSIPIRYKNIPPAFAAEKPLPESITCDIEAKGFDLFSKDFLKKNNEIIIDFNLFPIAKNDAGRHISIATDRLMKQYISFSDQSVKIKKIFPDSIVLDYSKRFTRKVPVKLKSEISFRGQFLQSAPVMLKPDSIEIAGKEEDIKKIKAIETQSVSFKNVEKNLFFSALLINPHSNEIFLSDKKVWVLIPVGEYTEGKMTVSIEKIFYHNKPVTLIPEKVSITYHASLKYFSSVGQDDFRVEIENPAHTIKKNESKLSVKLSKSPAAATIISIEPEVVNYLIEK